MKIDEIRRTFRSPLASTYPELVGYSREQIYRGKMGPGGLYLATQMARRVRLHKGDRVLDLGCGKGATSVFLAKKYEVAVVAVDLWVSSTELYRQFQTEGMAERIVPLNLDITGRLPFAESYFDAIFCMDSIHYYGGSGAFWRHLLPHLKSGGQLCIGSPCFSEEFSAEALAHLPPVYDDGTDLWPNEFSRYHSPHWWGDLLASTGQMQSVVSEELEEGVIFWEDDVLYNLDHGQKAEVAMTDAAQYTFRQAGMPYLTHFVLSGEKIVPTRDPEVTR